MCSPSSTYGLKRRHDLKTLEECAQAARDAGVNLFVACQNSRFFCYIYTNTRYSTTCASEHNSNKCNVYKVAGAPLSTIGKYRIISYPYLTCKGVVKIIVSIMFLVLFCFRFSDFQIFELSYFRFVHSFSIVSKIQRPKNNEVLLRC